MTDAVIGRLTDLVRTPSPTGDEQAVTDLVAGWLSGTGADRVDLWVDSMADLEADPDYPGREIERPTVPVVAAAAQGNRPGPVVVLTGHVDTVAVGERQHWTRDPFGAEIDGDRLYGRGACDMKAGLAAAIEAFDHFASGNRDFAGEVRFVAVPGEEDGGTGTLSAIRRGWAGDMVILTEPTAGDVVVAHGGALTFAIDVTGRAAHGSTPHEGISALDAFWEIHRAIRELEAEINASETDPLMTALGVPYPTNIGIVHGGTWASNVMAHLRAEIRVGLAVGEAIADGERRFTDGLISKVAGHPWLAEHPPRVERTGAAFGSSRIDTGDPLVTTVQDAAEATTGRRPEPIGVPYGCDMALWQRVGGARTVVYGPGDVAQAHTADEWVSMPQTVEITGVLVEAITRLTIG